jgi:Electron transfer DM13
MENDMRFLRRKWVWIAIGLPILIVAWLAFRPEKLWINQRVNEAAPFALRSEVRPIFVGRLEGIAHPTTGRATIYMSPDGKRYLRLTDFTTSNGPDVHVVLARAEDPALDQKIVKGNLDYVELGKLKGNQGDQNYDVPAAIDLQKYNAVVIYCERFSAVFGVAREESL